MTLEAQTRRPGLLGASFPPAAAVFLFQFFLLLQIVYHADQGKCSRNFVRTISCMVKAGVKRRTKFLYSHIKEKKSVSKSMHFTHAPVQYCTSGVSLCKPTMSCAGLRFEGLRKIIHYCCIWCMDGVAKSRAIPHPLPPLEGIRRRPL